MFWSSCLKRNSFSNLPLDGGAERERWAAMRLLTVYSLFSPLYQLCFNVYIYLIAWLLTHSKTQVKHVVLRFKLSRNRGKNRPQKATSLRINMRSGRHSPADILHLRCLSSAPLCVLERSSLPTKREINTQLFRNFSTCGWKRKRRVKPERIAGEFIAGIKAG